MGDSDMRGRADLLARGGEFREIAEALNMFADGQKPTIIAHSFGSGAALTAVTQWPEAFAGVVVCDLMIMRPALLEEYWNLRRRSEEHTSELQSLMRISYAVFCLKKKSKQKQSKSTIPNK